MVDLQRVACACPHTGLCLARKSLPAGGLGAQSKRQVGAVRAVSWRVKRIEA